MAAIGTSTRWTRRVVLGAVCALVIGFYAWSANSGFLESLGSGAQDSYYNLLVRGFRDGHLNVKREAPPGAAQFAGPADQAWLDAAVAGVAEMSYYEGKLYLYFGVTPALVLFWPYVALTGHYLLHKDAVAIFLSAAFLAGAGLLWAVWRRYFKETGFWAVVAGTLALGLANFAPAILRRGDVYEAAISCGYALTMLALAGVWCALQDARRGWRWLAAGSLAYGLALGARPSLLFGAVILLVPVARAWRMKRPVWPLLLAAAGPIVVVGLGLLLYNVLRFGNPLEFGENYQLPPAMNQHFSPRYLWFNFRISFLDPANWSGIFPFVDDITAPSQPSGYFDRTNPFGVLTNIPLVWLALAAPLAWRRRSAEDRSVLRWFLGAVALFFGMCALTICLYNAMSLRYELEFASPLLLLAVIGFLALERALAAQPVWRRAARCGWVLLLVFSVAFNLFAGVHMQAQLQCGLGTTLQQKGKVDEAITHYKKALQLAPGYAAAWLDLANALEQKGKVDEAVTQYRKALQIKPDYAEARCNLGNALLQMGKVDEAMSQFQLALQTKPGLAQVHNDLGTALLQKGGVDAAITQYETALQIQPDFAEAHKNLGIALLQKGRVDEAVAHLQKALQTKPDYAEAHFNLGNALAQTGAADEAIAHFQKALQIKPDYTDAHNNLGWVLLQHARVDEAIAHFQNALQIKPEFAEAHFNLANALLQKGEWGRAITQYQTALQIKPADPTFQSSLAWLLATSPEQSLRDGAKALALARQAETLSGGQNPVILRTLAAACAEQGDYALAAATARRALDLAVAQKNDTVAASLQKEIQLYEAGAPARLAPP